MDTGFNAYEECAQCGTCCNISVIAMTREEAKRIIDYVDAGHATPRDLGEGVCPFRNDDMTCAIYPVRSQTCRLHSCKIPRFKILEMYPDIIELEDKWYMDLRRVFLFREFG